MDSSMKIARQVLEAVRGDRDAIQKMCEALQTRDARQIQRVLKDVGGLELSEEDAGALAQDDDAIGAAAQT
jgi:hypothetical protein